MVRLVTVCKYFVLNAMICKSNYYGNQIPSNAVLKSLLVDGFLHIPLFPQIWNKSLLVDGFLLIPLFPRVWYKSLLGDGFLCGVRVA